MKLISIVVPVYNVAPYLERCIDSLVKQTYEHIEIILVDDGSLDHSFKIMQQAAKQDSRIVCIQKPNGGLSDARNAGFAKSHGEYVMFIDSDDYVAHNMCELMVTSALQKDADVVVCDMEYFYDDGHVSFASGGEFTDMIVSQQPSLIRMNNSACNKLFERSLLDDVDFPLGEWYEDLATIPIILCKARKIAKVNEALYFYYQRSGSIAHSANPKIFDIYNAISRVINYITENIEEPLQSAYRKEMYHAYIIHGLDLTTLRIKDFEDVEMSIEYLRQNMNHLNQAYPTWQSDALVKSASWKKRLIYQLLKNQKWKWVLKLYGKKV